MESAITAIKKEIREHERALARLNRALAALDQAPASPPKPRRPRSKDVRERIDTLMADGLSRTANDVAQETEISKSEVYRILKDYPFEKVEGTRVYHKDIEVAVGATNESS